MGKILSQSGISLADSYDIQGSIVGIENLDSNNVSLVHEMGGTIFSERLQTNLTRLNPGATAQNTAWNIQIPVPNSPSRIMACTVISDVTTRIDMCSLNISSPVGGREIVLWSWDSNNDGEQQIRFSNDGAAVATDILLLPGYNLMPYLLTRTSGNVETREMGLLNFRGTTNGFGAGTVEPIMILGLARATDRLPVPGQPSSHGLPVPSW